MSSFLERLPTSVLVCIFQYCSYNVSSQFLVTNEELKEAWYTAMKLNLDAVKSSGRYQYIGGTKKGRRKHVTY